MGSRVPSLTVQGMTVSGRPVLGMAVLAMTVLGASVRWVTVLGLTALAASAGDANRCRCLLPDGDTYSLLPACGSAPTCLFSFED